MIILKLTFNDIDLDIVDNGLVFKPILGRYANFHLDETERNILETAGAFIFYF